MKGKTQMKKTVLSLIVIFILLSMFSVCMAQEDEPSIAQQFPVKLIRDRFDKDFKEEYYRFPTIRPMFEPFDLSYFPHDYMYEWDWSLLRRKASAGLFEQMVLLSKPAESMVLHGKDAGNAYGVLGDFYLYATLFAADNYPAGTGSCYVYFSDSLVRGLYPSHGILLDPASGIYRVESTYANVYEPSQSSHTLKLLQSLSAEDYPLPEDISLSSFAVSEFDGSADEQFLADLNAMNKSFRMKGSPEVKAYRIEIIRKGFYSDLYINGKRIAHMLDFITVEDAEGNEIPDKVAWSYGPILYKGGITTTCSIGDLYIYGPEK